MKEKAWLKRLELKEIPIHMGLFDFGINCVIGKYESINEYIQFKLDDKDFDLATFDVGYECRGQCMYRTGFQPVIWIPRYPKTAREYATLAHESLHAVYHLFEWASVPMSRDTEEVVTHSMAHIINTILATESKPLQDNK